MHEPHGYQTTAGTFKAINDKNRRNDTAKLRLAPVHLVENASHLGHVDWTMIDEKVMPICGTSTIAHARLLNGMRFADQSFETNATL